MILSGGHLFEHPGAQETYRRFPDFFRAGQIIPIANARTIEDFVEIKSLQYQHTERSKSRDYSIYLNDDWETVFTGPLNFEVPSRDTTKTLALLMLKDLSATSDLGRLTRDIILGREKQAITTELFSSLRQVASRNFLQEIAFSISRNYQNIYRKRYGHWIFVDTGLVSQGLEEKLDFELSFPIAEYLFNNLNFRRLFRIPNFALVQLRGSIEHTRFVNAYRDLFGSVDKAELPRIGIVLERLLPSRFIGRDVVGHIDTQLYAVSNALENVNGMEFDSLYQDVVKDRQYFAVHKKADIDFLKYTLGTLPMEKADKTNYSNPSVFLVVAARQELIFAREFLRAGLFNLNSGCEIANRAADIFEITREIAGSEVPLSVALMLANKKGKEQMRALIEAIDRYEEPRIVIMIGMMAGIKGKANLLDVVAPLSIYDTSTVGTNDAEIIVEPEPGNIDPKLHNWLLAYDWTVSPEQYIDNIAHKKTVTVPGTFDDIDHELCQKALSVDPENIIGLEMEGYALAGMQLDQMINGGQTRYMMIKGVADYAGEKIGEDEIAKLQKNPRIADFLMKSSDPRGHKMLKETLQREATQRSLVIALRVLKTIPGL